MALEAAKGLKTINQLASEHGAHPNQVSQWKRQLLETGATVLSQATGDYHRQGQEQGRQESELYEQIGRLKPVLSLVEGMELEWLKKQPQE